MHGDSTCCPFAWAGLVPAAARSAAGGYGPIGAGDYQGVETGGRPDATRTEKLFQAIQERAFRGEAAVGRAPAGDGDLPPAGYTYLAQFAAHDLSLSSIVGQAPGCATAPVNSRRRALLLDTLYGGPDAGHTPWFSPFDDAGVPLPAGSPPIKFLLSRAGGAPFRDRPRGDEHPARDIGRAVQRGTPMQRPGVGDLFGPATGSVDYGVAVVADIRNDDQPLVAQLTALFKIAHNLAIDALAASGPPQSAAARKQHFNLARLALVSVFRRIVARDLLRWLLDPTVLAYYRSPGRLFLDAAAGDPPVSRDFAHAAFRACHAMVRSSYPFNQANLHRLRLMLDHTSTDRDGPRVPLKDAWIIDWSLFFQAGNTRPVRARPIGPYFAPALRDLAMGGPGAAPRRDGLLYRDLWSGAHAGIRRIETLLREVRQRQPALAAQSPWLRDGAPGKAALWAWLAAVPATGLSAVSGWMADELAANPPPLLYFLIEAAAANGGSTFGPLGSIVIADTVFKALDSSLAPIAADVGPPEDATWRVFSDAPPADMPALVRWVNARLNGRDKTSAVTGIPLPFAS